LEELQFWRNPSYLTKPNNSTPDNTRLCCHSFARTKVLSLSLQVLRSAFAHSFSSFPEERRKPFPSYPAEGKKIIIHSPPRIGRKTARGGSREKSRGRRAEISISRQWPPGLVSLPLTHRRPWDIATHLSRPPFPHTLTHSLSSSSSVEFHPFTPLTSAGWLFWKALVSNHRDQENALCATVATINFTSITLDLQSQQQPTTFFRNSALSCLRQV
jgi:hypothetical protein